MQINDLLILILGAFIMLIGIMYFFHFKKKGKASIKVITSGIVAILGFFLLLFPLHILEGIPFSRNENRQPAPRLLKGGELFKVATPGNTGSYEVAANLYARGTSLWSAEGVGFDSAEVALRYFTESIDIYETPEAYTARGQVRIQLGQMKEGMIDYNRALEINPEFGNAYFNRATLQYIMGNKDLACEDWKRAKKLNVPNAASVMAQMCV